MRAASLSCRIRTVVRLAATMAVVAASGTSAQQSNNVFSGLVDEAGIDPVLQRTTPPATGIVPLVGRLSFNGTALEATDTWVLDLNAETGDRRNTLAGREINFIFGRDAQQNILLHSGGGTFESRQSAWVFQLRATDRMRRTTTTRSVGGQLLGFNLDLSLTGRCFLPGSPVDGFCTYTPGLSTVPGALDPDTLLPTQFAATTAFGEEISQDVHESLKQPGFRRGEDVPGASLVGLHFDIPNAGFIEGQGLSFTSADRRLETQRRLVPSIGKIEQTISSNSREAAASRTTRAFVLLERDEWSGKSALLQLSAFLLPSASSSVDPASGAPNIAISNNLFFALNNARVPAESFTVFQTGRASVTHASAPARSAAETPVATYAGVWLGFSPVRRQSMSFREQFIPQGDRTNIGDPVFRQGGGGTPFRDLVDADFLLFDSIDQNIEGLNFQNIDDLFVQVGLGVTTQEAVRRLTTTETSRFKFAPHLSFNGNRTGGESVLRYYAGAIFDDKTNAYVGVDYALQTESGWGVFSRADLYSAPDTDYFSEVELRGSRTFALSEGRQLTLGAGAVVALDGLNRSRAQPGVTFSEDSRQRADFVARLREGSVDYTLRQRFSKSGGGGWDLGTTVGVSYTPDDRLSISAQATPFSTEATWLQAAAELNWRVGDPGRSQVLQLQAARIRYDLGNSSTGQNFKSKETTFRVGFQAKF